MSIIYFTKCNTCAYDLSEYFYKKIIEKVSVADIEKDIKQSCCRMCFRGQINCNKIFGAPKYDAINRKNNEVIPIAY